MAHHEAKKRLGSQQCMVLNLSPNNKIQSQSYTARDPSPAKDELEKTLQSYLIACIVEGTHPRSTKWLIVAYPPPKS